MLIYRLVNDNSIITTKELSKLLTSPEFATLSTPVVFKASMIGVTDAAEWVVIAHGLPGKPEFFDSVTDLRNWLNENTAINENDSINLVSCFAGTFNLQEAKSNKIELVKTYYPIIIANDYFDIDRNIIPIAIYQNDNDVLDNVQTLVKFYADKENLDWDSIPQEKKDIAAERVKDGLMMGRRYIEALAKKEG
jgi:hypothetical protein